MKAEDVMHDVVTRLVAEMEAGAGTWSMPWSNAQFGLPRNAVTGNAYKGGNIVACWIRATDRMYPTETWATFNQWRTLDASVRKGEKGLHLVKWSVVDVTKADGTPDTVLRPRGFVVFNPAQVDGWDDPALDRGDVAADTDAFSLFALNVPARTTVGPPCYVPARDIVMMPGRAQFDTLEDYQSTYAHELAHWTGHESRLNRDMSSRFGSEGYAMEELVAELSAAFTCASFNITPSKRADHASYLSHWCAVLKADPRSLWSVASRAQAATDHLFSYADQVTVTDTTPQPTSITLGQLGDFLASRQPIAT
jgi:antirestriction protein ArdC